MGPRLGLHISHYGHSVDLTTVLFGVTDDEDWLISTDRLFFFLFNMLAQCLFCGECFLIEINRW